MITFSKVCFLHAFIFTCFQLFSQTDTNENGESPIPKEENKIEFLEKTTPKELDLGQITTGDVSIFDLSLEDLMGVKVNVGSNTSIKKSKIPVSLTTITEEDILLSGARNIYDLIEIYVPGATWLTHGEGPKVGMRGIISDRNNKFLLRVNGVLMVQKAHVGIVSEMENWDLNDISKIEVIRGPGSVTYGPGAIGGVIDITTKDANNTEGTKIYSNYVTKYDSKGTGISHTYKTDNLKIYAYGSVQETNGYMPNAYIINSSYRAGYVGKDFGANTAPVNTYFADFRGNPQYKAHIQGTYGKGWNFFVRYAIPPIHRTETSLS